jgi:methionyl-tRNA formyltransferase
MTQRWIALFSQTGSEIARLATSLGRWPDGILTNNFDQSQWSSDLDINRVTSMNPTALHNGLRFTKERQFITLHGYMRIIPADVCEMHDIYNGHPGLITLYPELKGKDPQEMAWEGKYGTIGSVVHHCTAELDGGEIVNSVSYVNRCDTKEELYNKLKEASFIAWDFFLRGKV